MSNPWEAAATCPQRRKMFNRQQFWWLIWLKTGCSAFTERAKGHRWSFHLSQTSGTLTWSGRLGILNRHSSVVNECYFLALFKENSFIVEHILHNMSISLHHSYRAVLSPQSTVPVRGWCQCPPTTSPTDRYCVTTKQGGIHMRHINYITKRKLRPMIKKVNIVMKATLSWTEEEEKCLTARIVDNFCDLINRSEE